MVGRRMKNVLGAVVAGSLMLSSTAAIASVPAPAQVDPWAVLTAMSGGAPAAAICGSAAAAAANAQASGGCVLPVVDAPPPPLVVQTVPPPVVATSGGEISPLFFALAAIAVGAGIYLLVSGNGHANSPA
jgi:hypothetical protein